MCDAVLSASAGRTGDGVASSEAGILDLEHVIARVSAPESSSSTAVTVAWFSAIWVHWRKYDSEIKALEGMEVVDDMCGGGSRVNGLSLAGGMDSAGFIWYLSTACCKFSPINR